MINKIKTGGLCFCCTGNRRSRQYKESINLSTCSANNCKHACKIRYHNQCIGPLPLKRSQFSSENLKL
ncbi:unnamed protein product [Rotaria sordida]|uniref:Uncharacterized protein n=1 Tax=Rotaria sordida TaxID=392033 RepID=A0A818Z0Y3_9BILA|nr:unnamed protein product [Rotaria sordida]